jgi:hypothetical protein
MRAPPGSGAIPHFPVTNSRSHEMPQATFTVPFEDMDYERWAAAHGMTVRVEPRLDGLFDIHLEGPAEALARFELELGWSAE